LFAVDDTHLMDDFSWSCMSLFAENTNTMVLLTRRVLLDQQISNETAVGFINDSGNMAVYCSGLSVFHLASIACQFLNVARIPNGLDHVLRLNSMGIPSWIDLLLREYVYEGVIQTEWTLIFNHTETMVVPAPRDLMEYTLNSLQQQNISDPATAEASTFIDELRLEAVSPNAQLVCNMLINQTDDLKVPTSITSMIQARIDHMQEVDQNVLKSASIIGNFVFREILQHMLRSEIDKEELGQSIQRLANSGAFACASTMKKSRGRAGVAGMGGSFSGQTCICYGAHDERPMTSCRILIFLSASLRMTAYEMMLEQNRRPLHISAANFLEEKIQRISVRNRELNEGSLIESYVYEEDDGEKRDTPITPESPAPATIAEENEEGGENDSVEVPKEELHTERKKRLTVNFETRSDKYMYRSKPMTSKTGSRRVVPMQSVHSRLKSVIGGEYSDSNNEASEEVKRFVNKHLRSTKSKKAEGLFNKDDSVSIAVNLARLSETTTVNFTGYERLGVLRVQYPLIAEQYRGAGNTQNTVYYLVEAAAICLALFDHQGAIAHLRDVNRIFRDLKQNKNPFEGRVANLDNWKPEPFDEGQMESLVGETLFFMEKPKKAMPHFRRALKLLGCEQLTSRLKMKFRTSKEYKQFKNDDELASLWDARCLSLQARCLFYLFDDCIARADLTEARYVAVQQLVKTELAADLIGQIESATCMLKLAHLTDDTAAIQEHEVKSKVKCVVAMQNVRNDQVVRLTRLYWTAFEVHLARDPIGEAIESGLMASRMMKAIRGVGVIQVHLLACLVKALVYADRCKEAMEILDYIHNEGGRGESRGWYYWGCLRFVLVLGVRVALLEDCLAYSEEILVQKMFVKRPQLLFCLACSLCLYYRRVQAEDRLEEWRKVAAKNEPTSYSDNFLSMVGFMDLLECKLLQLSKLTGEIQRDKALKKGFQRQTILIMNQKDKQYLQRIITRDFSFAEQVIRRMKVIQPRLLMLQAYYAAIHDRMTTARSLIEQSIHCADDLSNVNYSNWAQRNCDSWFGEQRHSRASVTIGEARRSTTLSMDPLFGEVVQPRSSFRSTVVEPFEPLIEPSERRRPRRSLVVGDSALPRLSNPSQASELAKEDQWLKSASTTFPHWSILNQIRTETRLLLIYSLPLPKRFGARFF